MKVFISHALADRAYAARLAKVLTADGHTVVYPGEAILPGDNLLEVVARALNEANAMVVLLSPEAMESQWVQNEIEQAIGSFRFRDRLIPVMLRKTPKYPWILRELQVMSFEPKAIAARIRQRNKPQRLPMLSPA